MRVSAASTPSNFPTDWLNCLRMRAYAADANMPAFAPPVAGLPIGAYLSVALLLVGGITALPAGVALVYDRLAPWVATRPLPLLAIERARRVRETASVAVMATGMVRGAPPSGGV